MQTPRFVSFTLALLISITTLNESNASSRSTASASPSPSPSPSPSVETESTQKYIVVLRPNGGRARNRKSLSRRNLKQLNKLESGVPENVSEAFSLKPYRHFTRAFQGFAIQLSEKEKTALKAEAFGNDSLILDIVPDVQMELHQAATYPIITPITEQVTSTGFQRMGLDLFPLTQITHQNHEADIDVAVLDTGVDFNHPDLNVFFTKSFAESDGSDYKGHGTHVAGIIGARDNDIGVVGVLPGARIWNLQVFSEKSGEISNILSAMEFVAQNAATIRVANASFGTVSNPLIPVELLRSATQLVVNSGVVLVASAGNEGRDIMGGDRKWDTTDDVYPAAFKETLTVSAMNDQDGKPGSDTILRANISRVKHPDELVHSPGAAIDLTAPGAHILSTFKDGQYAYNQGTSMAAPHIAGLAGLYLLTHDVSRDLSGVVQVRQALIDAAEPQSEWQTANTGDFDNNREGMGRPLASWIQPTPPPCDGEAQIVRVRPTVYGAMEIEFTTTLGCQYSIQAAESFLPFVSSSAGTHTTPSPWATLTVLSGTGNNMKYVDSNTSGPSRFYRIQIDPPQFKKTKGN